MSGKTAFIQVTALDAQEALQVLTGAVFIARNAGIDVRMSSEKDSVTITLRGVDDIGGVLYVVDQPSQRTIA